MRFSYFLLASLLLLSPSVFAKTIDTQFCSGSSTHINENASTGTTTYHRYAVRLSNDLSYITSCSTSGGLPSNYGTYGEYVYFATGARKTSENWTGSDGLKRFWIFTETMIDGSKYSGETFDSGSVYDFSVNSAPNPYQNNGNSIESAWGNELLWKIDESMTWKNLESNGGYTRRKLWMPMNLLFGQTIYTKSSTAYFQESTSLSAVYPTNNSTNIPLSGQTIRFTFDESIAIVDGTKKIQVREYVGGSVVYEIAVSSASKGSNNISFTIPSSANLQVGTQYYVMFPDGAITDTTNDGSNDQNLTFGGTSASALRFTTMTDQAPTLTSINRQSPSTTPTNSDSLTWRFTFSEAVTGVASNDFVLTGSTASLSVSQVSSSVYDVTASGGDLANKNGTVSIALSGSASIQDSLPQNLSSTSPTGTNNNSYSLDNTAPTLSSISPSQGAKSYLLNSGVTLNFDSVISKGTGNITLTPTSGSVISVDVASNNVSVSGSQATISVSGIDGQEAYSIQIPATAFADSVGNAYAGVSDTSTLTYVSDTTAPAFDNATITMTGANQITANLGEALDNTSTPSGSAFTVTVGGLEFSVSSVNVTGNNAVLTLAHNVPSSASVTVSYSVPNSSALKDASGNLVTSSTGVVSVTPAGPGDNGSGHTDNTAPSVTISSSTTTSDVPDSFSVTVTFSEPVTGFSSSDVSVANAVLSNFAVSTADTVWTFDLAPSADGAVTVDIASGAAQDVAGNSNTAASQLSMTRDVPKLSSTNPAHQSKSYLLNSNLTLTFDESISKGTGNITITPASGSAISVNVASSDVTVSGSQATIAISGVDGKKAYTVQVPNTAFLDAVGNEYTGLSGSALAFVADTTAPAFDNASVTVTAAKQVTADLGEALDAGQIPAASAFTLVVGNINYTITNVAISGSNVVLTTALDIPSSASVTLAYVAPASSVLQDASGNQVTDSTSPVAATLASPGDNGSGVNDSSAPSVTITTTTTTNDLPDSFSVSVQFNEVVDGFTVGDIQVVNATLSNFTEVTNNKKWTFDLAPTADGAVTVDIANNVANDAAGNANTAATQLSMTRATPLLLSYVPTAADGRRTSLIALSGLVLTYSETVVAGSGNIVFTPQSGSGTVSVPVTDTNQVAISGSQVTVNPTTALDPHKSYTVTIDATALDDTNGASYKHVNTISLAADTTAPSAPTTSNTSVGTNGGVEVDFGEPMRTNPAPATSCFTATVNGVPVTINSLGFFDNSGGTPNALLALSLSTTPAIPQGASAVISYDSTCSAGSPLADAAGNEVASFSFTSTVSTNSPADTTAPTVTTLSASAASGSTITTPITVNVVFSEVVGGFEAADMEAVIVNGGVSNFKGSGTTYSFTLTPDANGAVSVQVPANAAFDVALNHNVASATTLTFTADGFNPVLTATTPADDATGIMVDADLTITFDRVVNAGSGNVKLYKSDGSLVETFDVTGDRFSGFGTTTVTVDITDWLLPSTSYYVLLDGAGFKDSNGNPTLNINSNTAWNFATAAGHLAMPDPTTDATIVKSLNAQLEMVNSLTSKVINPVVNRLSRLHTMSKHNTRNVSVQGIKLQLGDDELQQVYQQSDLAKAFNFESDQVMANDWAIWSEGRVTTGTLEEGTLLTEFEIDALTLGVDNRITPNLTLGVAAMWSKQEATIGSSGSRLDADAGSFSAYGSYILENSDFFKFALGYSDMDIDTVRIHDSGKLVGKRDSDILQFTGIYGYEYEKDDLVINPYGQIDYSYSRLNPYTESGTSAAINYHEQITQQGAYGGGVRTNKEFEVTIGKLIGYSDIRYQKQIYFHTVADMSYVVNPSHIYTLESARDETDLWTLGVGLDYYRGNMRVGAGMERVFEKNREESTTYNVTLEGRF